MCLTKVITFCYFDEDWWVFMNCLDNKQSDSEVENNESINNLTDRFMVHH